mmetsp:Transcript_69869/g.186083  ORF Transcript_69869/g.186083 Transcript_69869/m.186083 type:complete len:272 (-) Transcript_69869:111-926(-)
MAKPRYGHVMLPIQLIRLSALLLEPRVRCQGCVPLVPWKSRGNRTVTSGITLWALGRGVGFRCRRARAGLLTSSARPLQRRSQGPVWSLLFSNKSTPHTTISQKWHPEYMGRPLAFKSLHVRPPLIHISGSGDRQTRKLCEDLDHEGLGADGRMHGKEHRGEEKNKRCSQRYHVDPHDPVRSAGLQPPFRPQHDCGGGEQGVGEQVGVHLLLREGHHIFHVLPPQPRLLNPHAHLLVLRILPLPLVLQVVGLVPIPEGLAHIRGDRHAPAV